MAAGAPDQRAQPRENFLHLERFGDVVVGAAVDPLDLLVPAATSGQHQYRGRQRGVAPLPEECQAIDPGETEVEEHGVVVLGARQEIRPRAVGGGVDRVTRVTERCRQLPREAGFVFDDENTQAGTE